MMINLKCGFLIVTMLLSLTAWSERLLTLLEPVGGEAWVSGEQTIRWELGGDGWDGTETLTIECTRDYGETWSIWAIDASAAAGSFVWDVSSLPAGASYRLRIECNEDTTAWDISDVFRIGASVSYYVNDTTTDNDVYCTAPGASEGDGASPGTPNSSLQYVLNAYALQPGDTIWLDTGQYTLTANITIGPEDAGTAESPLRILGSPNGSVLDRNAPDTETSRCLTVTGDYVNLGEVSHPLQAIGAYYGISLEGTGVEANACVVSDCGSHGISVTGLQCVVQNCLAQDNAGNGIHFLGNHNEARNSQVYRCTIGAYISGDSNLIADCIVSHNSTDGIRVHNAIDTTVIGNSVHNNGIVGITIWDVLSKPGLKEVIGNLVVKNGTTGINANAPRASLHIINNTIAENGSFGFRVNSLFSQYVFRNNIVCADGPGSFCVRDEAASSTTYDYNTYYTSGGALTGFYGESPRQTMGEWRGVTQQDSNSITADPLFADPENNDYRLRSTGGRYDGGAWVSDTVSSPAIDAGDPSDPVNAETLPHGDVINQGAYGGTAEASRSPMDRVLTLIEPLHNERYPDDGEVIVRWRCTGQGWLETDSLTIEVTSDYGDSWLLLDSNAPAAAHAWAWDLTGLSAAANYQLRITSNEAPAVVAASSIFRVGSGLEFYVNDTETEDVFCTAPGSPDGDGLSPSTPNTSLQFIIDTYPLQGGDIVWIDAGHYLLEDTITIAAEDAGADQNPIRFLGATDGNTLLDRNDTESHAITINSRYIQIGDTLHPVKITGGKSGVYLNFDAQNITIQNCEIFGCTRGIETFYGGPFIIEDTLLHHNQTGILLSKSSAIVRRNQTLNNVDVGIVCDGSAASIEENLVAENGAYGISAVNVLRNPGAELIGNQILDNGSGGVRGEAYDISIPPGDPCVTLNAYDNTIRTLEGTLCFSFSPKFCGTLSGNTCITYPGEGEGEGEILPEGEVPVEGEGEIPAEGEGEGEGEGETPVEGEGEIPTEGEGETPAEGEGEMPAEGEGEVPVEGEGEIPAEGEGEGEGEGETPVEGEGEIPTEGEGEMPAEGEGEMPAEGEGEVLPEGEGESPAEGEGETPAEGEGEIAPEGEGEIPSEGEGETLSEGEGEVLPEGETPAEGEGELLPEGEGEIPAEGEGEGEFLHEGEVLPEGEGEILLEGEGEILPEGEGETSAEGEGEILPEGEGEIPAEGEGETPVEGEAPAEGEGEIPAEGEGEIPAEGEGEVPAEGEGETPAEGEGEIPAEGEGEAPVEGEGETPAEGEGEIPAEGEGEVPAEGEGEMLPEGEGEVLPEGEGETPAEGEGEISAEGEGEVLPEGEGEIPAEGEGETPPEGEGEVPAEGEGETPVEGEGEISTEGEGEIPAEGEGEAEEDGCGCGCNKSDHVPGAIKRQLGDLLLLGLVVISLFGIGYLRWPA